MIDAKKINFLFNIMEENKENLKCLEEIYNICTLKDEQEFLCQYDKVVASYPLSSEPNVSIKTQLQLLMDKNPESFKKLGTMLFNVPSLETLLIFYGYYLMWEKVEPVTGKRKQMKLV